MEESLVKNKKSLLVLMTLLVLSFGASFGMKNEKDKVLKKGEQELKKRYKEIYSVDLTGKYVGYEITSNGKFFIGLRKMDSEYVIEVRKLRDFTLLYTINRRYDLNNNINLFQGYDGKCFVVSMNISEDGRDCCFVEVFDLMSGRPVYLDYFSRNFFPNSFVFSANGKHIAMIDEYTEEIASDEVCRVLNVSIFDLSLKKEIKRYLNDCLYCHPFINCKSNAACLLLTKKIYKDGLEKNKMFVFDLESGREIIDEEKYYCPEITAGKNRYRYNPHDPGNPDMIIEGYGEDSDSSQDKAELQNKLDKLEKKIDKLEDELLDEVLGKCGCDECQISSCYKNCLCCSRFCDLEKIYGDGLEFCFDEETDYISIITNGDNPRLIVLKDTQNFVDNLVKNKKYKDCLINCQN